MIKLAESGFATTMITKSNPSVIISLHMPRISSTDAESDKVPMILYGMFSIRAQLFKVGGNLLICHSGQEFDSDQYNIPVHRC